MITKKDAINLVKRIALGARVEIAYHGGDTTKNASIRGATYRSLNEIWYEILSIKVREQFNDTETGKMGHEVYLDYARGILNS